MVPALKQAILDRYRDVAIWKKKLAATYSVNIATLFQIILTVKSGEKKWVQYSARQSTPVLLPRKFHGWRSLVGYSPWGNKESDRTKQLHWDLPLLKFSLCAKEVFFSNISSGAIHKPLWYWQSHLEFWGHTVRDVVNHLPGIWISCKESLLRVIGHTLPMLSMRVQVTEATRILP